jgi:hypothetical protein
MQDAIHIQKFRKPSADLDPDQIITASAAREVAQQKASRKAPQGTHLPKVLSSAPQHIGQLRRLAALQEELRASTSRD